MNAATPTPKGTARPSPPTQWQESSQNSHVYANGLAADFIYHSIAGGYSYADQALAGANLQASFPPFVGHSHNRGRAFDQWQNQQGAAAFAGHYATPQPQLPVLGQLGVGHPSSGESIESILVKLRPRSAPPPVLRSVLSGPNLNHLHQQQQQHQHAMSPSPSLPFPHVPCYGDYVPLLVNVRKLQHDDRLKALIDANELELNYYPDYFTNNQVKGGYPFTASTSNQGPPASTANQGATPPPGGEEGGGDGDGIYQDITLPASPKKDLFVFHVPNHMTEEQLHNLFSHIGQVRRARIQYDMNDNSPKGYGFVTFKRLSDAVVAVHSLNGFQVSHR